MQSDKHSIEEIMKQIKFELKNRDKDEIKVIKKKIYEYSDFTQYNDIEFIKRVFKAILQREADQEGLEYYLKLLRNKGLSKIEIITAIRYTKEGKERGVKIIGANREYFLSIIKKIPIIGLLFEWILFIIYLPRYIKEDKQSIKPKYNFEEFYIAFEDKFRGTKEEIKDRLSIYIPYIKKVARVDSAIIDIGCGRGEWIELLSKNGFINIRGVDSNSLMVEASQNIGAEVIYGDAIKYISKLDSSSIRVITGFHIIEHLPFEKLILLFQESYRVLEQGGIVIFETPNPENLLVGACNFYTDITHYNPLVPRTVEFLAEFIGFKDIEIKRVHPRAKPSKVDNIRVQEVIDLMNCGQDYAIIGYKI